MKPLTNRQKQALATKQKIFDCAVCLFAEKSFENITVQDICTKAGVSIGAFYHHFESKENILDEGYRLFDQHSEDAWNEGHPDSPLDGIHFLITKQTESMENMGAPAALQYFKNQLSSKDKYILNPDRFFYRTIMTLAEDAIQSGRLQGDAYTITEDILAMSRGIIYDWCLHSGVYSLSERALRHLDMIFKYYENPNSLSQIERE